MRRYGHRYDFLDAQEVLKGTQDKDIPSSWCVFRISQKKLGILILGFCGIMCVFVAFLASYLLVNFDHHPPIPSNALYTIAGILCIFAVGTILLSFFVWVRTKNVVLVLLPEGFVHGDSKKLKVFSSIFYKNVAKMYVNGSSVLAYQKGKSIPKQIDCRLFERPAREVASTLIMYFSGGII